MKKPFILFTLYLLLLTSLSTAQTLAPGAPGKDAYWSTAGKQAIGTSATLDSKVWFTLAQGVMTEVYYPNVTVANVQTLQFIVVDPKTKKVDTEKDDSATTVSSLPVYFRKNVSPVPGVIFDRTYSGPGSLAFEQTTSVASRWSITKHYVTDPANNSVVFTVDFSPEDPGLELYVYYDPSLANTGLHDTGWTDGRSMVSVDGSVASALSCGRCKFVDATNGFLGVNDGLTQLRSKGKITDTFSRAENGNLVQVAKVETAAMSSRQRTMVFVLGFGPTTAEAVSAAQRSLEKGYEKNSAEYQSGWADYLRGLPKVDPQYQAQFNMAAMVLKAQEDKTVRGANVASLTIPWGGGVNANEDIGGGYHLVWARDLYHVFTAYLALGDKPAAERALDFLFNIQQKEDGSFPQNSWLDGKRGWGSLQMDEVGYPLIMAWQLGRFDKPTYEKHVKRAADFLVKNGPKTPQERWEEEAGFSPSTIAAEIAGLVCAADIAKRNGDEASAIIYLAAADDWARNIERMTATTTGPYGDGNYYLRITQNANPDSGDKIELNNGAGTVDERTVVDAGFLELVRLGIKPANDPLIAKSIKVIDEQIRVQTPNGDTFYRYTKDGYGEMDDGRRWNYDGKYTGKGRPWPLLTGERGQYELAKCVADTLAETRPLGRLTMPADFRCWAAAKSRLNAMLAFANEGLMIPEQVWDKKEIPAKIDSQYIPPLKFGEGTGSATPLAWSMGQFIRLATNLKAGRNLDTPQIVYDRYKYGIPPQTNDFGGQESFVLPPMKAGELLKVPRNAPAGSKVAYLVGDETHVVTADDKGKYSNDFKVPAEDVVGIAGILASDGSTAFERIRILKQPELQKFSPTQIAAIAAAKRNPVTADGKTILAYRGNANRVEVAGDMTGWARGRIFMQKIGDDVHAVALDLAATARVEYKIIADGRWLLDPLNRNKMDNGVGGENSILTMPGYKATTWDHHDPRAELTFDKLDKIEINSKILGETRQISVFANAIDEQERYDQPVLYLQDGGDYVRRAMALDVWENLVAAKKVKPFIMVFIDPKDRNKEYRANNEWADFIADEVVPEIDKRYHTIANRDGRATLGASLGGITSLWIGLRHPDKFARLGGQSSSFWVDNERVVKELSKLDADKTKFRFYLDDGTLEGADDTRRVNVMLRGKGYPVTYVEGQTGHNWTAWRDRLADAFIALMN